MQAGAVAVAAKDEGARPLVEHEGKILGPHHRRGIGLHLVLADDLARHARRKGGLTLVVHHHRIAVGVADLGLGAIKPRGAFDDGVDALAQQIADLDRQGARRAAQLGVLRNDVVGMT